MRCFTGGHLPLAIMAILTLMFCVLLIIFVTAVVLKKIKVRHVIILQSLMYVAMFCIYIAMCIHIAMVVIRIKAIPIQI